MSREWMGEAACIGMDELFFAPEGNPEMWRTAKRVCGTCNVVAECYQEWASLPVYMRKFGIWAGLTAKDRANRRVRALCGGCGVPVRASQAWCERCAVNARRKRGREWDRANRNRASA